MGLKPALAVMLLLTCTSPSWAGAAASHDPELRKALLEAVSSADSFYDRFEAEVWLLDMSNRLESSFFRRFIPDQQERMEFLRLVHQESTRAKLPPEMVLALIQVVVRAANFFFPEWHDLHETAGPDAGYGESLKGAFHLNQRQHHFRGEFGAC